VRKSPGPLRASTRLKSSAFLAVTALACVFAIRALAPPAPLPAEAPAAEFSAGRAAVLLTEIAREPHPLGVRAHDDVRDAILRMWRNLGFEPEVQRGVLVRPDQHYGARVENILARLPGKNPAPRRALMLSTHYDSVVSSPGAADDGSGVVILLETARALRAGPPLNADVVFLITDAEEDGLLGSRVFLDQHPLAKDIGLVLNFEARGTAGPSLMFETSRGNRKLIGALASTPHPRAYSLTQAIYHRMPNNTDLSIFMAGGMQGLNFAFVDRPYDYHSPNDSLANLDHRSLQHQGSYALALARGFATDGVPEPAKEDAVYFSLIGDFFVRYSSRVALVLAGVVAILVLATGLIGLPRGLIRIGGAMKGALLFLAALILSAGLGFAYLTGVKASHGSWLPAGMFRHSAVYFLALIFLALATAVWLYGRFRVRTTGLEITFGAAVVWTALAVFLTLEFPEASFLVSWPAFLLAATALLWAIRSFRSGRRDAPPEPAAALAASILIAFIACPIVFTFFLAMFLSPLMAAILAALTALMATSILPSLEIMRHGLRPALVPVFVALFITFTAAGALTTRYSQRIPRPTSLTYVADFDKDKNYWVAAANEVVPWTEETAGGKFEPGHPLPDYAGLAENYRFREAPRFVLDPPDVRLVGDATADHTRTVLFRILSPREGRQFVVGFEADKIIQLSMEGKALTLADQSPNKATVVFIGPGPEGFEVSLQVPAGSMVSVSVRQSDPGLDSLSGLSLPAPPPEIQPRRLGVLLFKRFTFPAFTPEATE
jgi:hypothetical protein